ncbi:MAG TPA: ABC transporter permease [Candidatus Gallimonas intestinavium]|uniref:ABC transporter permease n=1 Tax=Candidatus Gallimonas intestinavium TaxID=2838603 RepID=A0A9D2K0I7_9FIRM|nr:ABC transporter permease [Candidatus Gallimonas intestinavium]
MKNTQENTVHTALSAVGHFFGELGCSLAKGLRKFFSNGKTIVGFAILVFFVLVAIFGPLLFPYNSDTDMANSYLMPSWEHPFGTDWLGRDVFRQVIAGTGSVLEIAFYSAVFTVVIGTVLGIVSGYLGGWVDKVIMAVTNIFLSIPSFPIYLLLAAIVTINTPVSLSVIISIWSWAGLCRAVRVQIMSLKERDFIQICAVMHMSKAHIIFRELLPNVFSYIAINFVMAMRNAIMASVGIMLVGLAAYDPTNWGAIINAARTKGLMNVKNIYILLYPLICIIVFQISTLLLANGLDETLNPRLKVM